MTIDNDPRVQELFQSVKAHLPELEALLNEMSGRHTRPIVEAFLHAKYFLEMVVRYGRELEEAPALMPSGWASVLYLYNLR